MSNSQSALISTEIIRESEIVESSGFDSDFPASNIQDPSPKVFAKGVGPGDSCHVVFDTNQLPPGRFRYNVFSALFLRNIAPGFKDDPAPSLWRVRSGPLNGSWGFDTGEVDIWPLDITSDFSKNVDERLPDTYDPPGISAHIYLGGSLWEPGVATPQTRFLRFDFSNVPLSQFTIGAIAAGEAMDLGALWGSSAGTPVEESENLWTWGDERIARPGPKYDQKSWDVVMTEEQKERSTYITLKRLGSSQPIVAVDTLPPVHPLPNSDPWRTHQKTLYGTITRVSPIIYSGLDEFRSTIEFQEL